MDLGSEKSELKCEFFHWCAGPNQHQWERSGAASNIGFPRKHSENIRQVTGKILFSLSNLLVK